MDRRFESREPPAQDQDLFVRVNAFHQKQDFLWSVIAA
jgi:hypothetical protein